MIEEKIVRMIERIRMWNFPLSIESQFERVGEQRDWNIEKATFEGCKKLISVVDEWKNQLDEADKNFITYVKVADKIKFLAKKRMQEISPNPEWDGKTFRLVEDGRGGKTPTIFSETENIFEPYFSEAFLAWSKQKERIMTLQVNWPATLLVSFYGFIRGVSCRVDVACRDATTSSRRYPSPKKGEKHNPIDSDF